LSAEGRVSSPVVVVVEEVWQRGCAVGVADEHLPVCPLAGEGAVEPLHLAVLPGAVGLDELVLGAELGEQASKMATSIESL
jgi:hypothetical protein